MIALWQIRFLCIFNAWTACLKLYNISFTKEWYYQHSGASAVELLNHINHTFEVNLDIEAVNAYCKQVYRSLIPTVQAVEAVVEIIRKHYGLVPVAIATGGERSIIEVTLQTIQWYPSLAADILYRNCCLQQRSRV